MSKLLVYSRWNQWLLIKKEGYSGFNTQVPNNLNFIISPAGTAKMAKKHLKHRKGTLISYLYKLFGLASIKTIK